MKKRIAILGSTGSIGKTTLDIVKRYSDEFSVVLLANGANREKLQEQIKEFKPEVAFCSDGYLMVNGEEVAFDKDYLAKKETYANIDVIVNGIVGVAGLAPTLAVIDAGKVLCTANKESFVVAGNLINDRLTNSTTKIHPMDSEHSTVWQCIDDINNVKKIVLTASGGAFRDLSKDKLAEAKAEDALKHPTWVMGKKVTIDCATLMNKGMEIIEAMHIFKTKDIDVVMHRESIVHSLVMMKDNTLIAGLSHPDMTIPIQYSLFYPQRKQSSVKELDLAEIISLNFGKIDEDRFPCFRICKEVARHGDYAGCVMNAANEVLVEAYINDKIKFFDIPNGIISALNQFGYEGKIDSVDDVLSIDREVKEYTLNSIYEVR